MRRDIILKMIELGGAECEKVVTLEDVRYWQGYTDALRAILSVKGIIND